MAAGRPAENPEFVLQANDVGITDIEEIRCPQIGGQILFLDFETNFRRILVATLKIVDRNRETLGPRLVGDHGGQEVGGECGDAAFAGQVIAEESDLPNLGGCVHDSTAWSACVEKQIFKSCVCVLMMLRSCSELNGLLMTKSTPVIGLPEDCSISGYAISMTTRWCGSGVRNRMCRPACKRKSRLVEPGAALPQPDTTLTGARNSLSKLTRSLCRTYAELNTGGGTKSKFVSVPETCWRFNLVRAPSGRRGAPDCAPAR